MPGAKRGEKHPLYVAQILRQATFSGCSKGSFCVGDAWFGSVAACLALKLEVTEYMKEDGSTYMSAIDIDSCWVGQEQQQTIPKAPMVCCSQGQIWGKVCWQVGCFQGLKSGVSTSLPWAMLGAIAMWHLLC